MPYIKINKPTGTPYTNVNNHLPLYDSITISYDDPSVFYDGFGPVYTNIAKPTGSSYTKIIKPTQLSFPSTIGTFTNPVASNKLNSPSHSAIETAQNNELIQIENVIGVDGASSIIGTIIGDLRSPGSNGGGHVQTANKGGTGQISYTKGDLLIATSTSVLSKLAVGADGFALLADSTAQTGMSYQGVATATTIQNETFTYARASVISASVYGIILSQPVSVLSDGLGVVVKFPTANAGTSMALQINATGPSSVTGLIKKQGLASLAIGDITSSMIGVLQFDSVSSVFQLQGTNSSPVTATGQTTYTLSTASATQTIAHGLGKTPKYVRVTFLRNAGSGFSGNAILTYNSANGSNGISMDYTNGAQRPQNSTGVVLYGGINETEYNVISLAAPDATNINLSWTKTGSPSGTAYMLWEVEG